MKFRTLLAALAILFVPTFGLAQTLVPMGDAAPVRTAVPIVCVDPVTKLQESCYLGSVNIETAASATTGATANVATLATAAAKTTYITGFQCTALGSTALSAGTIVVAGVITGSMSYTMSFPAGVTVGATPLVVMFQMPIPASAVNTVITVTLPAAGTGNTYESCNAQGFQR